MTKANSEQSGSDASIVEEGSGDSFLSLPDYSTCRSKILIEHLLLIFQSNQADKSCFQLHAAVVAPSLTDMTIVTWKGKIKYYLKTNWLKVVIVICLFSLSLIVKFGGMIQDKDVPKPSDKLQDATLSLNKFAMSHSAFRTAWQIIASLMLDIQFFSVLFMWMWKGYSLRVVFSLIMFYGIRAILQNLFILPFPDNYYWEYPGFP